MRACHCESVAVRWQPEVSSFLLACELQGSNSGYLVNLHPVHFHTQPAIPTISFTLMRLLPQSWCSRIKTVCHQVSLDSYICNRFPFVLRRVITYYCDGISIQVTIFTSLLYSYTTKCLLSCLASTIKCPLGSSTSCCKSILNYFLSPRPLHCVYKPGLVHTSTGREHRWHLSFGCCT